MNATKINFSEVPIDKWRPGYLWVSHLTSQLWCEQQMEYGFSRPQLASPDNPQMVRGSELHLARELESEEYLKNEREFEKFET